MTGAAIAGPGSTELRECLPAVAHAGPTAEETRP